MKRTPDNCTYIKKHLSTSSPIDTGFVNPYKTAGGKCEGLQQAHDDDEPADTCKKCELHYLYEDGEQE